MLDDLQQRGNKTAVTRSICGLVGSVGLCVIFFLNVFGLEESTLERWKWIVLVVCALAAVASIVNWVRAFSASLMRNIEKYCKKSGNPDAMMARLEKVWNEGFDIGSGKIDPEYIILTLGLRSKVIPLGNALWAYKKVTYGSAPATHLFVCYDNHKYHSAMLDLGTIERVTGYIYNNCPNVAVGYDKKLDRFYTKKDVQGFREYARNQRNEGK